MKSDFLVIIINDGQEDLRGVEAPAYGTNNEAERATTYNDTCSRILVANPDALASLVDPSIE